MKVLPAEDYLHVLQCVRCKSDAPLHFNAGELSCESCGASYPVNADGVLELVDPDELDEDLRAELVGNEYPGTDDEQRQRIRHENSTMHDSPVGRRLGWELEQLGARLSELNARQVVALGEGTGRTLFLLSRVYRPDTVFASDLSLSAIRQVPWRLADFDIDVAVFTSNLEYCPISPSRSDVPIVVAYALHHVPDMQGCLDSILAQGHRDVLVVEPITNRLLKALARRGLSERVEYSGVKPGRLELSAVRRSAEAHGYALSVDTNLKIPNDYLLKLSGGRESLAAILRRAVNVSSGVLRRVNVGNYAVIQFTKTHC